MKPPIDPALLRHIYLQRRYMSERDRVYYPDKTMMQLLCGNDRQEEWELGRRLLAFETWDKKDVSGILDAAILTIKGRDEFKWTLVEAEPALRKSRIKIAEALYGLYREDWTEKAFDQIMGVLHKIRMRNRTHLAAYYFFLKNPSIYVPYGEFMNESCFSALGVKPVEESWKGYTDFLRMIAQIQACLQEEVGEKVTTMQAYGFFYHAWRRREHMPEWTEKA